MKRRGRVELTPDDIAGVAAGNITMSEIAARCGVSRSAVSDYMKRHGIQHSLKPGAGVRASRAEAERLLPMLAKMDDEVERENLILNFRRATLLNLLDEASRIAAAGGLAPKSLRDLAGAVAEIEGRLVKLRLIPDEEFAEDAENPTLVIKVMSAEQADEIRRAAESDQVGLFGSDEVADHNRTSSAPEMGKNGDRRAAIEAARNLLTAIEGSKGKAGIRALAVKIGVPVDPRSSAQSIKKAVLAELEAHPELAERIAA